MKLALRSWAPRSRSLSAFNAQARMLEMLTEATSLHLDVQARGLSEGAKALGATSLERMSEALRAIRGDQPRPPHGRPRCPNRQCARGWSPATRDWH